MMYDVLAFVGGGLIPLIGATAANILGPMLIKRLAPNAGKAVVGAATKFLGPTIAKSLPGIGGFVGGTAAFLGTESVLSSLLDEGGQGVEGIDAPEEPTIDELSSILEQNARAAIPNRQSKQDMFELIALKRALSQFIDDDVAIDDIVRKLQHKAIV